MPSLPAEVERRGRSIWLNEKVISESIEKRFLKVDIIKQVKKIELCMLFFFGSPKNFSKFIHHKLSFKLEAGTRIVLPGFENSFAFKYFMTLLARMFGESDASRILQLKIEAEIPPTNGQHLPLTQLERLAYFRNHFRKNS